MNFLFDSNDFRGLKSLESLLKSFLLRLKLAFCLLLVSLKHGHQIRRGLLFLLIRAFEGLLASVPSEKRAKGAERLALSWS